ncbi:hypothetical protein TGP89_287480 [Toxoplasma gondii p89]|uniref:Uncharacterized protein n=1 Tax=Toxoplasma gondii p89 TaxID=943119 RepID=A0A086KI75_TOXGO|nr:hypothetical protein TGP89_287480 [Toxoplasma gondii p89]
MTAPPVSVAPGAPSPPAPYFPASLVPATAASHLQAAVRLIQEAQALHQLPALSAQDNVGKEKEKVHSQSNEMLPVRPNHAGASARLVKVLLLLGDFGSAAHALKYSLSLGLSASGGRSASKIRWLLRALGSTVIEGRNEHDRERQQYITERKADGRGQAEAEVNKADVNRERRMMMGPADLTGGEKNEEEHMENIFHMQFLRQDRIRIHRQLEELQREDASVLSHARMSSSSMPISLSLPPSPSVSSHEEDPRGVFTLLTFLYNIILAVDEALEVDSGTAAPFSNPPATPALCRMVTVSRASSPLPVPKLVERQLSEATRQLAEIFSPFYSGLSRAATSSVSPGGGCSSPCPAAVPPPRPPAKALASRQGGENEGFTHSGLPQVLEEKGKRGACVPESPQTSLAFPSSGNSSRKRRDTHVGRAQHQQRQLLLLQQQQQRSRNRLRQEKPRRLKFLHECDTAVSQLPFAFWKAFGRLMRVPHTHVPSCMPFASYEHMDALEQVWGDAWALSQLRSSGLSYKILHANATAAAFALAGKSGSGERGESRSKTGGRRDGRGSGSAKAKDRSKAEWTKGVGTVCGEGVAASGGDSGIGKESGKDAEDEIESKNEKGKEGLAQERGEPRGTKVNEKTGSVATPSQDPAGSEPGEKGASTQAHNAQDNVKTAAKTSSATAAARGALQGVIAAATGVAGAASGAPSLQWALWQLQSAMEGGTQNSLCESSGTTTPATREESDALYLCAGDTTQEGKDARKSAGEAGTEKERGERKEMGPGLGLLLTKRAQEQVLDAIEKALGGVDASEQGRVAKEVPLLVVLLRVIEALISTRSLWQLTPYGLCGSASVSCISSSHRSSSFSSTLTPVAVSCLLSSFISEGTRRLALASSLFCSRFSSFLGSGKEDRSTLGEEGKGQATGVLVKVEEAANGGRANDSTTGNMGSKQGFWWHLEWSTLQRLSALSPSKGVSSAVRETARVLLVDWLGVPVPIEDSLKENQTPWKKNSGKDRKKPVGSPHLCLQIAACLLSAAAGQAPYVWSDVPDNDAEVQEKGDTYPVSPLSKSLSPSVSSCHPFGVKIFHLSQLKELLDVAGECLYTAAASQEMEERANVNDESGGRRKEGDARCGDAGKEGEKAKQDASLRFYQLLKKLLAWLALLQRQLGAALGASGQTESGEKLLYSLPGDSGEGATGALAAIMLLADLHDEEERPWGDVVGRYHEREQADSPGNQDGKEEENTGASDVVDRKRTAAALKQATTLSHPALSEQKVDLGDVPPLPVLRRKAIAAAVAEGMDVELLESLVGPFASRSFARFVSSHRRLNGQIDGHKEGQAAEEAKKGEAQVGGAVVSPTFRASASLPNTGHEETTGASELKSTSLSSSSCFSNLQFSRACVLDALVDTLREAESQLFSLSLRLHVQARQHAAEETSAAISGTTSAAQGGEKEDESCLSSGSAKAILSSDLQADLLFFLHSTIPFISHITRQLSALSASSLSLSSLPASLSKHTGKQGGKEVMIPLLVFVTPVLESFFLRLTSLYGDLFTLLALTASRSLDAPLVSSLGAALDPSFSMEEIRKQRYGVHDRFVVALCSSLPVFLSSLGVFRRHSRGVSQREVSPGGCFEGTAEWWGSSCLDEVVGRQERGGGEDEQVSREDSTAGADERSGRNEGKTQEEEGSRPRGSASGSPLVPPVAALFPVAHKIDQPGGPQPQMDGKGCQFPTPTSQQVLPSLDTPFCMWGVAVPSKRSTAEWLLKGRELAQAEEAEDDDDTLRRLLSPLAFRSASRNDTSSSSKTSNSASPAQSSFSVPASAFSSSSPASPAPLPADGCYLHSSAARLCVALAAFTLIELVAVSTFCAACTSFLEKKKLPSLPTVAGPMAVAAGGGAGGAGAVFSAGVALVTIARKRGEAWKDFCFSGQLVRWTLHALLYLVAAPLEASAVAASITTHSPNVGHGDRKKGGRQGKRKRDDEGGEAQEADGSNENPDDERNAERDESLLWQLHPLTSILSVKEDDDGRAPIFLDGAYHDLNLGRGSTPISDTSPLAFMESVAEASAVPLSSPSSLSAVFPLSSASPHSPSSLSSTRHGSPPVSSSSSASPSSSFTLSLLGALGDVLGRNEERGVLDGGEYASRLAEVIRLSLEAEMVVRELAGGAGSSQLDGLPGFSGASPLSGAGASGAGGGMSKVNAGALLLIGEAKVKKGERGERAARAASAAPAAIALLPEWLTSAYRQEEELPWEKKIDEIWMKGTAPASAYADTPPTSILGGVNSDVRSRQRQLPGLELYLPPGMCTASLPLAALQVALRSIRPSPIRGFEREMLVLASSCSPSSLPCRPDADAARAAVREVLTMRPGRGGDETGAKSGEEGERGEGVRCQWIERAGTRLAPFATMSGSSTFLIVPLAVRLLRLHLCATAQCQSDLLLAASGSCEEGVVEGTGRQHKSGVSEQGNDGGVQEMKIGSTETTAEFANERVKETNATMTPGEAGLACCSNKLSFCWAASEVPDRLGDLAHSIACCYFLVYGQPVLPRPASPLDKLVLKTTKEQTRNNFIEMSLPATLLGVYIHRAVQKCGPWATEIQSKEMDLSVSTFLFPSRETREFGRSVVAVADALVFNSLSPPDVSLPPCLPRILHLPESLHKPPLAPYPPGLSFSLFWAYTADPLVLPHFLRLFLLLVVQHFQLQQSVQVPIPMQHLLQQQSDLLSSSTFSTLPSTLARLFPLPSLRSLCNLETIVDNGARSGDCSSSGHEGRAEADEAVEMGEKERLGESRCSVASSSCSAATNVSEGQSISLDEPLASSWQNLSAIRERIKRNRKTLGAASATVAAAEGLFLGCVQGDCNTLTGRESEGTKQGVFCGGELKGHLTGEEDEELEVLRRASFEGTRIYIKLDQTENHLSTAPLTSFSKYECRINQLEVYQLLLLLHMLPSSKQQYLINTYMADASQRESSRAALLSCINSSPSLSSSLATSLFPLSPSSQLSDETTPRLSFTSVQSFSRRLARAAIEALEIKPVHAISPSLRGFSLHLLQLLQQAQRSAASEPEALERAGFAIRAAACAPHNPVLWMAVGSLLLELLLLLLDKYCAAGRKGDGTGGGLRSREEEETARWARNIFSSFQANGQFPPMRRGGVSDSFLSQGTGSSPSPSFWLPRGVGGIGGGANVSPVSYAPRGGGKKGDRGAGRAVSAGEEERMLSSSLVTAASVASLWNQVGCIGDRAAPNEETLLQIFAHTALVINVCGEIWLAALRRFCPHVCVEEPDLPQDEQVEEEAEQERREAKKVKRRADEENKVRGGDMSLEVMWERMNVKKLSETWWIQMCRSGKKIEDPCDLQWRYLSTRLDVLLLLVLLWKQFRHSSSSLSAAPTAAGGMSAPTADPTERHRRYWMCLDAANEAFFAKANLGSRSEGLTPRQKEILELCGAASVDGQKSHADSAPSSSSQSHGAVENNSEKVVQSSLLSFAKHPSSSSQQPSRDEKVGETRMTDGSVEDVQRLRSFILEVSTLLRFVFNRSNLPLVVASSLCLEEEQLGEKTEDRDIWNWALVASLNRCRTWVEAETFLWHLPLMRSKWLARLARWGVRLPLDRKRAQMTEAGGNRTPVSLTPSVTATSFAPPDVAAMARAIGLEAARAIELPPGGAREQEKQHPSDATSSNSASLNGGRERNSSENDDASFFSSALFSSALCDAVDALMISCIQAFGAEAMLDPAAGDKSQEQTKDNIQSKGKRSEGKEQSHSVRSHRGEGATTSRDTEKGDNASLLSSPRSRSELKDDIEGKQGETEVEGCASSTSSVRLQGGVHFVSSRVSLSLFYSCLGDMEELVEAEGDVLPLAMPLYHLHALRLKIVMLSRGALWRLAALFPWRCSPAGVSVKSQDKGGKKDSKVSVDTTNMEVKKERGEDDGRSIRSSPSSIRLRRDYLLRRWLAGDREDDARREYGRLLRQGASGLCCGVTVSKERPESHFDTNKDETRKEEREIEEEELEALRPFQCPADVVADCIEALQYLALKSRQAGLWTCIPRLLLVNASLASGQPTLALRHLRLLFSRGATKLLPPDAWLSNHYQALKQRRPAYERSKFRLFCATVDTAILLTQAILQRTEKAKEEQLLALRNEDVGNSEAEEETKQNNDGLGFSSSSSVTASPAGEDEREGKRQSIPKQVAGEGWIFGGLEKVEHLDDLVQGVKFLVEQLELQVKLLRRLQLNELGTYLQLAFFQDPSPQNTKPGTPFYTLQTQIAQLCQSPNAGGLIAEGRGDKGTGGSNSGTSASGDRTGVQGAANFLMLMGSLLGSGGVGGQTGTLQGTATDEDGQQANKRMQREIVNILLKGTIDVFEYLVTYCPDVLDMREMHRAITQLFPEVGVPAVEPQNTYVATTASLDGRLLRLLRDAVTCVRNASPSATSGLLKQLKQLIREKAKEVKDVGAREEIDMNVEMVSVESGPQNENVIETRDARVPDQDDEDDGVICKFVERLENIFVAACRKLLYYNPPSPAEDLAASYCSEGTQTHPTPPPAVAVMRLSLGLPVQCGMEVQEIEKVTEALAAYAKATRAGAPSVELFLKSGRVTATPSGRGGKGHGTAGVHGAGGGETGRKERGRGGRGGSASVAQARGVAGGGNANAETSVKADGAGSTSPAETPSLSPPGQNWVGKAAEGDAGIKDRGGDEKRRKTEERGDGGQPNKTPREEPESPPAGESADRGVSSTPGCPVPVIESSMPTENRLQHRGP